MKTATITDFRSNMKERLQEVAHDQDILILSGPQKRNFVVLTLEQFNSMEETAHLMSARANTKKLLESNREITMSIAKNSRALPIAIGSGSWWTL